MVTLIGCTFLDYTSQTQLVCCAHYSWKTGEIFLLFVRGLHRFHQTILVLRSYRPKWLPFYDRCFMYDYNPFGPDRTRVPQGRVQGADLSSSLLSAPSLTLFRCYRSRDLPMVGGYS